MEPAELHCSRCMQLPYVSAVADACYAPSQSPSALASLIFDDAPRRAPAGILTALRPSRVPPPPPLPPCIHSAKQFPHMKLPTRLVAAHAGNLPENITERDLTDEFSRFGTLDNVWVARKPPGFAFIQFADGPRRRRRLPQARWCAACCSCSTCLLS